MPTPSQTDANKSETFATLEATYPNLNGTGPWLLLGGVKEEMDEFMTGLPAIPGTIRYKRTKSLFELSVSVDPQPAPISPPSTQRDVLDVRSQDASSPLYSWVELSPGEQHTLQHWVLVARAVGQMMHLWNQQMSYLEIGQRLSRKYQELRDSPSASNGGSPDSSSS